MKILNKPLRSGYILTLLFSFIGCGGGSTSTSVDDIAVDTTTKSTYSVTGTVPGTLIEAFCKDGSYYSVNSNDNGTSNHPFTITLPSDVDCKFVMTTNEDDIDTSKHIVTPLTFNDGTTTSTYFQLSKDLDLGYINLSLSGEGVQVPLVLSIGEEEAEINFFSFDPLDDDNDGIPNVYEDDDDDGIVNRHDDDDDNDGILDTEDEDHQDDTDGDGIDNDYDVDDDNNEEDDDDEDDNDNDSDGTTTNTTLIFPTTYKADAGRLLGAQCAQCHGTNGVSVNGWDSIAGESDLAGEFFDDEPIMSAQAHGYTNEEITLIGNWLKTLNSNDND
jgi:hypothetical protein